MEALHKAQENFGSDGNVLYFHCDEGYFGIACIKVQPTVPFKEVQFTVYKS